VKKVISVAALHEIAEIYERTRENKLRECENGLSMNLLASLNTINL